MYGRTGLDRFKKAQTLEPFVVANPSATTKPSTQPALSHFSQPNSSHIDIPTNQKAVHTNTDVGLGPHQSSSTQVGGGQSSWQPPDWAIEPRPGVYYLDVLKDGEVIDRINLDKRRHIFGRQLHTCDFVLDHPSVSRQHAAVVPHRNGSVYVIDLGSAHGTFVANERLSKDSPVEVEIGQSLRFAASTRVYILRKDNAALFPPPLPTAINLPPPPDPADEEAILAYNTFVNHYNLSDSQVVSSSVGVSHEMIERPPKKIKMTRRVAFKYQVGGELVEVVGVSDGADVETEPGPMGVKEGSSLVGKYESLVQTTVIPRGKESTVAKEAGVSPKGGIYDDLYGDSLSSKVGSSWAYSSIHSGGKDAASPAKDDEKKVSVRTESNMSNDESDDDDLFG